MRIVEKQVGRVGGQKNVCTVTKVDSVKGMPRVETLLFDSWNSLPDSYSVVKNLAFGMLALGSTYSCEQVLSCVNRIQSKGRSQLTNENLESCLKLKTTRVMSQIYPNFLKPCKAKAPIEFVC
ncbi:dimer_Tnp_hAT domain-containing protein [Trichonephila clavipes]|uniref:Dimer_Tnp_hAT domain-containing protein n=1 Tax=Trichonephila clavipes TaxID=2585209 RepID=A0A8X6S4K6_TRICX|nr:dimer_Tnp_hAT domain-containing protein [Trichonephila clavipes]